MKNIKDLKLSINSSRKNPLRDLLRKMSNDALLAEQAKASKALNAQKTQANLLYKMFIDHLLEVRGVSKPSQGIGI